MINRIDVLKDVHYCDISVFQANDDDAGHLGDVTYSMLGDNQL